MKKFKVGDTVKIVKIITDEEYTASRFNMYLGRKAKILKIIKPTRQGSSIILNVGHQETWYPEELEYSEPDKSDLYTFLKNSL